MPGMPINAIPFQRREPEVARILRERPLTQGEPVLEDCKAPDIFPGPRYNCKTPAGPRPSEYLFCLR